MKRPKIERPKQDLMGVTRKVLNEGFKLVVKTYGCQSISHRCPTEEKLFWLWLSLP